jgi:hypothetical protein
MQPTLRPATLVLALAVLFAGCEEKKPAPRPSTTESVASNSTPSPEEKPAVVAYPPGYVPPVDAGDAPPPEPKTGVCSFQESGYDGQDTRSNEKMVVKLKDDKIVAAEYRYRGSYALDGKSDSLSTPVAYGKWVEFEMPMTSGTKKFEVKIKGDDIEFKGTATQDAQGDCVWKMANEEEEKEKNKDKSKDKSKKK